MRKLSLTFRLPKSHKSDESGPMQLADSQPFDLQRMEHEAAQKARRRLVMRRTALGCIGLLLLAAWFLQPGWLTGRAIKHYQHGQYQTARKWLIPLTWVSPQPFVFAYNSGTIDTKQKHYDAAQTELVRAVALAPAAERCLAVQNLVYSVELHSADLKAHGDSRDAAVYTTQATSYKKGNAKCFQSSGSSQSKQGTGGGGGASATQSQSTASQAQSQAPSAAQQQQIQQKEQQGEQQQQQDAEQDSFNPNNPSVKQW